MNNTRYNTYTKSGKAVAGFILIAVGLLFLLQQFNWFFFPNWLFSWPMILIIVGLVKRANNPNNLSWLILIVVGGLFLLEKILGNVDVFHFGWPVIIIAIGVWLIFRQNYDFGNKNTVPKEAFANDDLLNPDPIKPETHYSSQTKTESSEDFLNTFSIFSGVKKTILSKAFKGGEIVNIFGGTDLDFSHADINGQVVIDVIQLFGGTKLIVPPHWQVVSDAAAIFGGVSDKRIPHADVAGSGKVLVLKGASIFGGIDIKSF